MSRPEWVHCIADTHQDNIGKSLCGRVIGVAKKERHPDGNQIKVLKESEFVFRDVDHWFVNARNEGRLQGCDACVSEIWRVILSDGA